ncbi:MAG TPA: hypothetical protein ENJ18_05665, partial [Nannocystis exedens]|nr:hypothetical protein [Nannocystis exedens]
MTKKTDHDPALDAFIADVAKTTIRPAATPPRLDFGEVLRRAHTLDPSPTTKAMIDEAAELATVVRLASRRQPTESPADPALDNFLRDVRARNEAIADDRQLAGIPPQPLHTPPSRRPRVAALIAIAASLALFFLVGSPQLEILQQGPPEASQALMEGVIEHSYRARRNAHESQAVTADSDANRQRDADSIGKDKRQPATSPLGFSSESGSESEPESVSAHFTESNSSTPTDDTANANSESAAVAPPRLRQPKASADELAELDKAAQEAWRRGDLKTAAKNFRTLIRRDRGRHWTQ